jgi:tRNA1Val (adenine37-N6)-methyltransferase
MSNSWFRFKRFMVNQEDCAMKVGTDGVLLGAWADIRPGGSVLDIGTGTGVVALMAAQRGAGSVTAVEVDAAAAAQAARNAADSEWADRIEVVSMDVADYKTDIRFDRILSNPPYFRDSLRSPDTGRNTARHNDSLSYETLVSCSASLLAPEGLLCVVLPYDAVGEFIRCASDSGLNLTGRTDVVTVAGHEPKRSLLSFSPSYSIPLTNVLCIRDAGGNETDDYVGLVRDFYLKY